MGDGKLVGTIIYGFNRCPQCGVSNPLLTTVYKPSVHQTETWGGWYYATVRCSKCNQQTLLYGHANKNSFNSDGTPREIEITKSYPNSRNAADALPDRARRYLQQALDSLHAPDGVVMLAASSIDSMLKEIGYKDGTLFSRIKKAHSAGVLTEQMQDWAHEIRLSANEPRHADEEFDGANLDDAKQVIEFAEALGEYLFVLPARITKWKTLASGMTA